MTVKEAKVKYGDPDRNYYVSCPKCPFDKEHSCFDECTGFEDTWEYIAKVMTEREDNQTCENCAHKILDVEHPTCKACIYEGVDNYEEKTCSNCKYFGNDEYEAPCAECRNNFWRGDINYQIHEFLWESPQCVPEPTETVKPTETDNVNHPSHYTQGGIECIDAMVSAFGKESVKHFCICNAFKYVWRSEHKNGIEDIDKAIWYLNKVKELSAEG